MTNVLTKPFCYLCSNSLKTLHEVNLHNQTQTNINTLAIHLTTNVKIIQEMEKWNGKRAVRPTVLLVSYLFPGMLVTKGSFMDDIKHRH